MSAATWVSFCGAALMLGGLLLVEPDRKTKDIRQWCALWAVYFGALGVYWQVTGGPK